MTRTSDRVEFTLNGWDGKSYDGETRKSYVYLNRHCDHMRFVRVGKNYFKLTGQMVVEKATGIAHEYAVFWG